MTAYGDTLRLLITNERNDTIYYEERITLTKDNTFRQFDDNIEDFKVGARDAVRDLLNDARNNEEVKHISFQTMAEVLRKNGYKVEKC